jgi:ADP-heptose:LPS heptosyltransferase
LAIGFFLTLPTTLAHVAICYNVKLAALAEPTNHARPQTTLEQQLKGLDGKKPGAP